MKKALAILLLVSGSLFSVSAREPDGFLGRLNDLLTRPNPKLDTNFIAHPVRYWTVSFRGDVFHTGTSVNLDLDYQFLDGITMFTTQTGIHPPVGVKPSLYLAYGPLKLGFGRVIGGKGAAKSNSFSILRPAYGINFQYYNIKGKPESIIISRDGDKSDPYVSEYDATLRTISADTYYAFNNKRFIYNATYNAYHLQKRSAGSCLLTGKYQYGELQLPTEDLGIIVANEGIGRYRTHQFSFGFGYGYNWVPYHRDATDGDDGTLRNFTANITLVPMVVVSNRMFYTTYAIDEIENVLNEDRVFRLWGGMGFDMVARCALCYTFGRYSLGATFNYNRFRMVGSEKFPTAVEGEELIVTMTNRFYDWSASLRFDYRF